MLTAFERAGSFMDAADLADRLGLIKDWTPDRPDRVEHALQTNDQIYGSYKAMPRAEALLRRHKPPMRPAPDDVPF